MNDRYHYYTFHFLLLKLLLLITCLIIHTQRRIRVNNFEPYTIDIHTTRDNNINLCAAEIS